MPLCIICHLDIDSVEDVQKECPNGHPIHEICLKEWLNHSKRCPLCSEPFPEIFLNQYKNFLELNAHRKENSIKIQQLEKTVLIIDKVAQKMVFLKQLEIINHLTEIHRYEEALERLGAFEGEDLSTYKGQYILFLKGKIHFLRERYDLSINCLFKLVKEKFDFPNAFLYLGKSYEQIGLIDKAKWAYNRCK